MLDLLRFMKFKDMDHGALVYTVPGKPIPLARARHANGHVYDSQKQEKAVYAVQIKKQHNSDILWNEPVILNVMFYMKIPKAQLKQLSQKPHIKRPDLSNLIKFVEDVCTGIVYTDDSIISACYAYKTYSLNPRTEFFIEPWSE